MAGLMLLMACGRSGEEPPLAQETPTVEEARVAEPTTDGAREPEPSAEEAGEPEPTAEEAREPEPPDRPDIGLVDNLLAKLEADEWTLGEGLVETLKLFAGELDAAQVLRHPDSEDFEGTGIYEMAHEYLEDGPDAEARAEINRLLGLLVFSNDQLEAMAGLAPVSAAHVAHVALAPQRSPEEDCLWFFRAYQEDEDYPPGVGQCLEVHTTTLDGKRYRIFRPVDSLPQAGWTNVHYDRALKAVQETVPVYRNLGTGQGKMQDTNIVFSVGQDPGPRFASAWPTDDGFCYIVLYTRMKTLSDGEFKQVVAHELAHCMQRETFPVQYDGIYRGWWTEGTAHHFSNLVYNDVNLEWDEPIRENLTALEQLEQVELSTSLFERSYENFIFFQYLDWHILDDGIFDLIQNLPSAEDIASQRDAMANYPGIDEIYHDFAKAMTDEEIEDTGGGYIPYEPPFDTISISGPQTPLVQQPVIPFGVIRLRLEMLEKDQQASLAYTPEEPVLAEARPVDGTSWTPIPKDLPTSDEECGGIMVVVTTIEPDGEFDLDVTQVRDTTDIACQCLIGRWILNNEDWATLTDDPQYAVTSVTGSLEVEFEADGSVEWLYSDFTRAVVGTAAGPEPGRPYSSTINGGGRQQYSTPLEGILAFSGPEIHVSVSESVGPGVENFYDTGLGDLQTDFFYQCEGDALIIVKTGRAGPVELHWMRVE